MDLTEAYHSQGGQQLHDETRFLDQFGAPLTPFADFLRSKTGLSQKDRVDELAGTAGFSRFCDLPLELVSMVCDFCDAATLFQLMRACSRSRKVARRRFWKHPGTRYYVSAQWLVSENGFPGSCWHCPEFAKSVTRIEVGFRNAMSVFFRARPIGCKGYRSFLNSTPDPVLESPEEDLDLPARVRRFWRAIGVQFPAVRSVVTSCPEAFLAPRHQYDWGRDFSVPELQILLASDKPSHIDLIMTFPREQDSSPSIARSTEMVAVEEIGTPSERLVPYTRERRVLLPVKSHFHGPLGKIQHLFMRQNRLRLAFYAAKRLRIELYKREHFDSVSPMSCGRRCCDDDCTFTCAVKGDWRVHFDCHDVYRQNSYHFGTSDFRPLCCASAESQSLLDESSAELRRLNDELDEELYQLRDTYLQGQREDGNDFFDAVAVQLRTDPQYAQHDPRTYCEIFNFFLYRMEVDSRKRYMEYKDSH